MGIAQEPGRNVWQSVNDHFRAYLNLPEEQRPRLDLPPIAETAPGEKFHNIYTKDCRPLENTTYLESRGITKSTIANPQFAGRILNQLHTVQREGMPAKTYVNTAFPAYHEGRVVGLELKGEGFKGQAPESQFTRSLWLSKLPEGAPAARLVVSESALDTLSFAQLHPGEKGLYASTAGTLTQNKIFELKRLLTEEQIPGIRAVFDNDTQGHYFDTRLLAGLASDQNPMKVVREHEHLLTVEIITTTPASVQALSQQLKAYNDQTTQQYAQENGAPASSKTLRDELIHSNKLGPHSYQFHIPMSREALGAFNQAASQALAFEHRVEIAKSQGKDWNQDLKQAHLQQVVQRELGSTVGAPAHADGERLLMVEFREGRDAMSQLPALRENIEKVGLTIDHSVKLETTVAREIATALTLRYRLDSPQLPAISAALDMLAQNPKATVVEPAPDAAERRRLAAAQEQQRQAGPQLVPSDSPGHDQARQSFIQAAGQVVKELRESAADLDAARLQEVSKQLVRKPELTGLNRENVEKVLAVVDRLEALKGSPAVQQLRQAVQVLEAPARQSQELPSNKWGLRL